MGLKYVGAKANQFLYCPYGVDITEFALKSNFNSDFPLRFVYIGNIQQRKGIFYLLEAFKHIPKEKATLTIIGAVNKQDADLQPYLNCANFTGIILHSQIPFLLRQADVLIFPSLCEGLSLSCMEAAACGLPLVVSKNSGINDLITEGKEGFVIPIQSVDAIVEKVNWFIEHPEQIEPMGRAARQLAEKYTWDTYYERAGKLIQQAVKK